MAVSQLTGKQIKDQSVDLAVDVTGVLPPANGGLGDLTAEALVDSSTVVWDVSGKILPFATVPLTANRTLSILNPIEGARGTLILTRNNDTSSRTWTLPGGKSWLIGSGSRNQVICLDFQYSGSTFYFSTRDLI